jgi:hypothetical protein
MISKFLKSLAIFVVAVSLASCAKLPSIPNNQLGPEITTNETNESLYYSPAGPSVGSSQEQIINGFLYAGNGPQDDYVVAREFLTKNFASKWHPSTETLIQTGSSQLVSNTGTKVRLKVSYDALVTSEGNYISEPGASRILEFRLLQENGQWRIASAPNLTTLLAPNYKVLFKAVPVYFWDKSFSYLVPDVRWFPTRASLATKLTNAIIAGPSPWLAPAVQNVVPNDTKLNINSVTVDAGTASIDFNSSALKVPNWKRPYLRSQLLATLGSIDGVSQIAISVERTIQLISSGPAGTPDDASILPIILTENGLSHIAGTALFDISGTKELVRAQAATDFAVSRDESTVVLLGRGKVVSYKIGLLDNSTRLIDNRAKLITPSIDPFGDIWTATANAGANIRVTNRAGDQYFVANPFGPRVSIRALAISPEGARVAMLHDAVHGVSVHVFAIVRDKSHKVTGFGEPLSLKELGPKVESLAWLNGTSLTALTRDGLGFQSTSEAIVGGPKSVQRGTVNGNYALTVLGGSQYYVDTDGGLFVSRSLGWDRLRVGVRSMHMAG